MAGTTTTLHYDNGDSDLRMIQSAVDSILLSARRTPPFRARDGRLLLDLSRVTGQAPVDLGAVAPDGQLTGDDLAVLQVKVGPDGQGPDDQDAGVLVVLVLPDLDGSAQRAGQSGALTRFWEGVLLPAVQRLVGRNALGPCQHRAGDDDQPASGPTSGAPPVR